MDFATMSILIWVLIIQPVIPIILVVAGIILAGVAMIRSVIEQKKSNKDQSKR